MGEICWGLLAIFGIWGVLLTFVMLAALKVSSDADDRAGLP